MIQKFLFFLICACIMVISWLWQNQFLPNWDVSWDLLVTERLMHGGTYTHDFFQVNPPLIFFEYMPVIWLSKVFDCSVDLTFRFYLFILISITLLFVGYFTKFLFKKKFIHRSIYFFITMVALLAFPGPHFGEREHLLVIFSLPYFLLMIGQLEGIRIKKWLALSIGLYAFLGFLLKPYFLIPVILIESYAHFSHQERALPFFRIEMITLLALTLMYLMVIYIFYPDYIFSVLPVAIHTYYASVSASWKDVFFTPYICFCYISLIFYFIPERLNSNFNTIFALCVIGFVASYLIQRTGWAYHILPAMTFSILLCTVLTLEMLLHPMTFREVPKLLLLFILSNFTYALFNNNYLIGQTYKKKQQPMFQFLQQISNESAYFITANSTSMFPAVIMNKVKYASRFLYFFWLPGMVKNHHYDATIESNMVNMVIEDFNRYKPTYVFIDVRNYKIFYKNHYVNYLSYLLKNKTFNDIWNSYRYLTNVKTKPPETTGFLYYDFAIYKRCSRNSG